MRDPFLLRPTTTNHNLTNKLTLVPEVGQGMSQHAGKYTLYIALHGLFNNSTHFWPLYEGSGQCLQFKGRWSPGLET